MAQTTIPLTPEQRIRELEEQLELANQKAEFFESVINVLKNDYGVRKYKTPDDVHQAFYRQKTVNLYQD